MYLQRGGAETQGDNNKSVDAQEDWHALGIHRRLAAAAPLATNTPGNQIAAGEGGEKAREREREGGTPYSPPTGVL
jgi:hypothetical protein